MLLPKLEVILREIGHHVDNLVQGHRQRLAELLQRLEYEEGELAGPGAQLKDVDLLVRVHHHRRPRRRPAEAIVQEGFDEFGVGTGNKSVGGDEVGHHAFCPRVDSLHGEQNER